jgi:hypothetical protein
MDEPLLAGEIVTAFINKPCKLGPVAERTLLFATIPAPDKFVPLWGAQNATAGTPSSEPADIQVPLTGE